MGSYPINWNQESSNTLTAYAKYAIEYTRANPGEPYTFSPLASEVYYDPDEVFPPSGIKGCWVISRNYKQLFPPTLYRQNEQEAVKSLRECWGQQIYNLYDMSSDQAYKLVESLNADAVMGYPK